MLICKKFFAIIEMGDEIWIGLDLRKEENPWG